MDTTTIIVAKPEDIDNLQKISQLTFAETFAPYNTAEDMDKYLNENLSVSKLSSELRDNRSRFYFAICNTAVAGYLKLNFGASQTEIKDRRAVEIERIYVSEEFQGKHIGQMLFDKAMENAEQTEADYIWLGVWEKNTKAIRFYEKNGFVEFDRHTFRLGNDKQIDIMMKKNLR